MEWKKEVSAAFSKTSLFLYKTGFLRVSPPPFSPGASGFCISVWKRGGGIARKEKGLSRIEKKKGGPETTPPRKSDRKKKWKKAFSFFIRQERKSFHP